MKNKMTCKERVQLECYLEPTLHYALTLTVKGDRMKLTASRNQYEYCTKLFSVLDVRSEGFIQKEGLEKFLDQYCPLFLRRDILFSNKNQTIDEIWSLLEKTGALSSPGGCNMSGFLLVCRFVILIQFHETTRQYCFEQRMQDEQEAMVVMIQKPQNPLPVPPLLSIEELQMHDSTFENCIPPFDLYLDSRHNNFRRGKNKQRVSVEHFCGEEYVLRYTDENKTEVVVRRYLKDWRWFHNFYKNYGKTGGILCGRILPSIAFHDSLINFPSHSSTMTAVANVGIDAVHKMAQTVALSYYNSTSPKTDPSTKSSACTNSTPFNKQPEDIIAKTLERYLNYYLENPALASSFALHTMLNATQSGLDAAKCILKYMNQISQTSSEDVGKIPFQENHQLMIVGDENDDIGAPQIGRALSTQSFMSRSLTKSFNIVNKMSWVRTAAQAAMSLKVHGILETTGCQSASSKLQHASLPKFDRKNGTYEDVDVDETTFMDDLDDESFEDGVVSISSELDGMDHTMPSLPKPSGGFDLLPSPRPLSERSALCAGTFVKNIDRERRASETITMGGDQTDSSACNTTHYYRESTASTSPNVRLGELSVENDIERLYRLVAQVQNTMKRCQNVSSLLTNVQKKKRDLILSLWKGRWLMVGATDRSMILQHQLLSGIEKLAKAHEISLKGTEKLLENISWEYTLAKSVVKATRSVHSTVRASKTAERAKGAAESALQTETDNLESMRKNNANSKTDEIYVIAQKKLSNARSQSIRAALLEHEAMTAKRRATFALTFDVKVWNVHRKREMLKISLDYVREQVEASRSAILAWEELRNGLLSSSDYVDTIDIVCKAESKSKTVFTKIDPIIKENNERNTGIPSTGSEDSISNLVLSLDNMDEDEITEISNPLDKDEDWKQIDGNEMISNISVKVQGKEECFRNLRSPIIREERKNEQKYSVIGENCSSDLISLKNKDHMNNDISFNEGKQNGINNNPGYECNSFGDDDDKLVRLSNTEDIALPPNVLGHAFDCTMSNKLINDSTFINESHDNLSVSKSKKLPSDCDLKNFGDEVEFKVGQTPIRVQDNHTITDGDDESNLGDIQRNEIENDLTDSMQSLVDGLMTWGGESEFPSSDDLLGLGNVKDTN